LLRFLENSPPPGVRAAGTLLLLHAFPLNAHMWEPQLPLAAAGWHVVAPHFRGFDRCPHERAAESLQDYVEDIVDLLDALAVQRIVVAGLSMGGYAAFAMLKHAPGYVKGLVLANTRPQADTPDGKKQRLRMLTLIEEHGTAAVADEMLPKLLGGTTQHERPDLVARVRAMINDNQAPALSAAVLAMMRRDDSVSLLADIAVPTLVIAGEEDAIIPVDTARDMHRHIAHAELAVIPRAGHLANLEQPLTFNSLVGQFLARF
jgi:pimeloyl-ACP methyl ester carboxylesterase